MLSEVNAYQLNFYLPHHLQIYHTTALTLLKACIIHCLTYKDWNSCAFPSDMCTPLAKIIDPPLIFVRFSTNDIVQLFYDVVFS